MQCIVVKNNLRCTATEISELGVSLPIVKPDAKVFICIQCIDQMSFIAHQVETPFTKDILGVNNAS